MAYIETEWKDQKVEKPKTYELQNNPDGTTTLIDSFGVVTELGTPVNAEHMNHIEKGIAGTAIRLHNMTEVFAKDEWVKSGDKLYKSKQDQNKGHAVTEPKWYSEVELGASKEVLDSKANTDLANTASKLANSFIEKLIPDYSAGINKGLDFISDGFYYMYISQWTSTGGSVNIHIKINEITMDCGTGGGWGVWICPFIIRKGDKITITKDSGSTNIACTCYPLKGAN